MERTTKSRGIVEVEWQFDVPSLGPVAAWLRTAVTPGYTVVHRGAKQLADTYYDTLAWSVHHGGYTCRVRESGGAWLLTLKQMAEPTDGLRSRMEIEHALPPVVDQPAFSAAGEAGAVLRALAGRQPLQPLFRLTTERTTYALLDRHGPIGEIVLDDTVVAGGQENLARVEVEVRADAVQRARPFVDTMVSGCEMEPATRSKFEAGLRAAGLEVVPLAPALGPEILDPALPAGDYAIAALRRFMRDMLRNEPGTRLGEDIEALHDMRVATRRLRAAFRTFRAFLPADWEPYRREIGWVGQGLGEVRDLDVQLARASEWEASMEEDDAVALGPLRDELMDRRPAARARMLEMLDSDRYARLVDEFGAALRLPPQAESGAPAMRDVAGPLLLDAHRRLRKRGDRIRPSSPASDYHRLRIDAKRLSYTLEFLGPVFGKPARNYLTTVRALQSQLGLHQDAEVAVETLREIAFSAGARLGPATLLAMGAVAERYRAHGAELRARFPRTYSRLSGKRWRALRARAKRR